jgi:sulfide dehydrogenase [flavocytochrome c] flavoprotein chain
VVAADILAEVASKPRFPARFRNTCWSMLGPDNSVKIGANYAPGEKDGKALLIASGAFVSATAETAAVRQQTFKESAAWYDAITADAYAKKLVRAEAEPEPEPAPRRRRRRE